MSPLQVTLTRGSDGETLNTFSVKLDPYEVLFAEKKAEPGQAKQGSCTLSVNVGKRNLYLITVSHAAVHNSLCLAFAIEKSYCLYECNKAR